MRYRSFATADIAMVMDPEVSMQKESILVRRMAPLSCAALVFFFVTLSVLDGSWLALAWVDSLMWWNNVGGDWHSVMSSVGSTWGEHCDWEECFLNHSWLASGCGSGGCDSGQSSVQLSRSGLGTDLSSMYTTSEQVFLLPSIHLSGNMSPPKYFFIPSCTQISCPTSVSDLFER